MLPALLAAQIIRQVALGVYQLHQQGVCHRDIRASNVILAAKDPLKIKLIDFGFSCMLPKDGDAPGYDSIKSYMRTTLRQPIRKQRLYSPCEHLV